MEQLAYRLRKHHSEDLVVKDVMKIHIEIAKLIDKWMPAKVFTENERILANQMIFALCEQYSNQSKWISVEDRLPPERVMGISEDVIVSDESGVFVDCYDYEFTQWCKLKYKSKITHWMPLPNKPKL